MLCLSPSLGGARPADSSLERLHIASMTSALVLLASWVVSTVDVATQNRALALILVPCRQCRVLHRFPTHSSSRIPKFPHLLSCESFIYSSRSCRARSSQYAQPFVPLGLTIVSLAW